MSCLNPFIIFLKIVLRARDVAQWVKTRIQIPTTHVKARCEGVYEPSTGESETRGSHGASS